MKKIRCTGTSIESCLFWLLFGGLVFLYATPILGSIFLPFSDLPGHIGVVGAVMHRDMPSARINDYFWINPNFAPNCLEFYFTLFFGEIFSVLAAARLFALLCVIALPFSFLFALNSFGRSRWLVFAAFPFSYPRILWFGFMGSALGVSLMFLSIGAAWQCSSKRNYRAEIICASSLCLCGAAHPFFFLASMAMVSGTFIIASIKPHRPMKRITSLLVPGVPILLFHNWFSTMLSGKATSKRITAGTSYMETLKTFWDHLQNRKPESHVYLQWLDEWSLHAYMDRDLEHKVMALVAYTAVGCLLTVLARFFFRSGLITAIATAGTRAAKGITLEKRHSGRFFETIEWFYLVTRMGTWRRRGPELVITPLLFLCIAFAYLNLPGSISFPVVWWAVAQRLVTPLFLFALLLIPKSLPRAAAPLLAAPAIIAGTMYGLHLRHDFVHHFNGSEMKGFQKALSTIPEGKRVLGLYDDKETHYAHFPLHFAASYYVALRGGFALPFPVAPGYKDIAWAYPVNVTPGPPWGKIQFFNYSRHGRFYDFFLIKGRKGGKIPWHRFPTRCVKIHGPFGLWWVAERTPDC